MEIHLLSTLPDQLRDLVDDPVGFIEALNADLGPYEEPFTFLNPNYVQQLAVKDFGTVDIGVTNELTVLTTSISSFLAENASWCKLREHLRSASDVQLPLFRRVIHFEVAGSQMHNLFSVRGLNAPGNLSDVYYKFMAIYMKTGAW
jgi:hypothetical protein